MPLTKKRGWIVRALYRDCSAALQTKIVRNVCSSSPHFGGANKWKNAPRSDGVHVCCWDGGNKYMKKSVKFPAAPPGRNMHTIFPLAAACPPWSQSFAPKSPKDNLNYRSQHRTMYRHSSFPIGEKSIFFTHFSSIIFPSPSLQRRCSLSRNRW